MPKFALSQMQFDEISLVPGGDNEDAKVVLSKAKIPDEEEEKTMFKRFVEYMKGEPSAGDSSNGAGGSTIDPDNDTPGGEAIVPKTKEEILKGLPAEVQKDVQDLIDIERDEAENDLIEALEEFDGPDPDPDPEPDPEGEPEVPTAEQVLAKADPVVRQFIEKMQADTAEAQSIAKAEREMRIDRDMIAKAHDLKNIPGTPEEKAEVLKEAYGVSDEFGKKIEQQMKASNAALDNAGLFGEVGKGTPGDITVGSEIEGKAAEIMKADPTMTKEAAIAKVYEDNPALYDETLKEG